MGVLGFYSEDTQIWGCASQANVHSSPVQSESAALSKWMYGMKAEEEGRHLPLLMNSTKNMQLKASPSPFSSSFSLHSVCVKRGLFIIIQGQSWLKVIKPCPSITLAFQPVTGPSIKGDTGACGCVCVWVCVCVCVCVCGWESNGLSF